MTAEQQPVHSLEALEIIGDSVIQEMAEKGRLITKVIVIYETVGVDEEAVGGSAECIHMRRSDSTPMWTAVGMLQWATASSEDDLHGAE